LFFCLNQIIFGFSENFRFAARIRIEKTVPDNYLPEMPDSPDEDEPAKNPHLIFEDGEPARLAPDPKEARL